MAAPRATAALLGLVLALSAGLSPAAASRVELHEPHGIAGDVLAGDHVLELLQEAAQEVQARTEPPGRPAFTLWPAPPPETGHLFARAPVPPRLELTVPAPSIASEIAETFPETRIRAFGLFDPILHPGSNRVSRENATGYALGLWRNRVGPTQKGLWTDPVTGISYARARWYDARNAAWLSEDPLLDIDSPNLYAFVGWQPTMGTDPLGTYVVAGRDEIESFREALRDLGLPHLARQLRLTSEIRPEYFRKDERALELDSRIVIVGPKEEWEEVRSTSDELNKDVAASRMLQGLADLIRESVETPYRIQFDVTDEDLSDYSGAVTLTTYGEGFFARTHFWPDKPEESLIRIKLNPAQVAEARVPGEQTKIPVPFPAAVLHEYGHAYWYFHEKGSPEEMQVFGGPSNARAVKTENRYRYLRRYFGEILPLRSDH